MFWASASLLLYKNIADNGYFGVSIYAISDWLINYSTGFVRRGLSGSGLLWLYHHFDLRVELAIVLFAYLTFGVSTLFFVSRLYRIREYLPIHVILILLFLPSAILMPLHDFYAFGRKEGVLYLILIAHILIVNRLFATNTGKSTRSPIAPIDFARYQRILFLAFNGVCIPMAFVHEGLLFMSIPVNFALTYGLALSYCSFKNATIRSVLIYVPTILICVGIAFASPAITKQQATAICQAFGHLSEIMDCNSGWAFYWLTKSAMDGMEKAHYRLRLPELGNGFVWFLLVSSNLALAIYAAFKCQLAKMAHTGATYNDLRSGKTISIALLPVIAPIVGVAPLFIFTLDWGRWVSVSVTSAFLCAVGCNRVNAPAAAALSPDRHRNQELESGQKSGTAIKLVYLLLYGSVTYILMFTMVPHVLKRNLVISGLAQQILDFF